MRPVVLHEAVDAESVASTPGIYAAEDTSPAYGVLTGLAVAGEARDLGNVQTADGHHMAAIEVGPKRNAAGAITIGAEFFAGAKADYSSWEEKWWREAIQNAVDAGASEVHCKVEYLNILQNATDDIDERRFVQVSCGDDGVGMTEDVLLNKFLVLGRSGKGSEPGSVGGFGKAKELLLLPWVRWSVMTQRHGEQGITVSGHGIQYDVAPTSAPGRHGTLISVVMAADDATSEACAINFIKKCFLPKVAFFVNGKPYKANLKVGELVRSIGDDAHVYFDKKAKLDNSAMLVRVNGMYMHERWLSSSIKGTVVVELLGRSTELLTSNRDGIGKRDLRYALDEFQNQLAADVKTALRKKKGILRERFEGAGKFQFRPEIIQRDILFAMGDTFPKDGTLSSGQRDAILSIISQLGGQVSVRGEIYDRDEGTSIDLRPSRDSIAAMMEVSFLGAVQVKALAKQAAWQPDFFLYNEVEGWKVPAKFRPEKMTPALRKLARFWAELCRFVLIQLNSEGEYGVGWIFEREVGAAHQFLENEHWLLLNPFANGKLDGMGGGPGTGELLQLNNPEHINWLYAAAVHECTHMADGITQHDEAFASAFTQNVAKTANRGKQIEKIRKSVTARAATPGIGTEAAVLPAPPEHVGVSQDAGEALSAYLAPAGEAPGIGHESRGLSTGGSIERLHSAHGSTRYRWLLDDGTAIGVLQVVSRDNKVATIANVYVEPGWRRAGIARRLLEQAREDFREVRHADDIHTSPDGMAWRAAVNPAKRRCIAPHAQIIADPKLWEQCEFVGIQVDEYPDEYPDLELRDCTCGSTLSKPVTGARKDVFGRTVGELEKEPDMPPKENPAWVTSLLAKHFEYLEETVPAKWLPKLTKPSAKRGKLVVAVKEWACGSYGCAYPTLDQRMALKVTTDDTEYQFANELSENLAAQVTCKYHLVAELPEKHRGRTVYLLWRDAADHVGDIDKVVAAERSIDPEDVERWINVQHRNAQVAYAALMDGRPAKKLIDMWEGSVRLMAKNVPELRELASGMIKNLHENRVFMGDLHAGNIGLIDGRWLCVDPGHIAVLQDQP